MRKVRPLTKFSLEGLTLIELLVVTAIIAFLSLITMFVIIPFLQKSRDSVRKSHLEKYRVVLEEYREDYGVYPDSTALDNCSGTELQPYLDSIYCDPIRKIPYRYVPSADRLSYSLYADLEYADDPIVASLSCDQGCGPDDAGDGGGDYNYGLNPVVNVGGGEPTPTPTPLLEPTCGTAGNFFCYANQCGLCCPGSNYKCNSTGTGCFVGTCP